VAVVLGSATLVIAQGTTKSYSPPRSTSADLIVPKKRR